ncbi:hypothetical protein CesoFtcFv8_000838 [Champsocephalus esox]|uniref:Uncharacterized protein n=2 Tax=Champsocephalus TaxID=52236 RepID=A0AAN8E4S7_CHAGU|nr:hypothetical protein CesoFtcFv8_000838 [Champsocephalus esox]KAK5935186.1 hypothetical protein CgunFtcFv8_020569 [Champsocephalus gunnari]
MDRTFFILLRGQCGVSPVNWRRDGGSRCFYPPPPSGWSVCLSGPRRRGSSTSRLQQPAASLLLSPALLRPCGLARRPSFLRDNKSADSLFSTEGWIRAFTANGGRDLLIYKHWISPTCLR